MTKKKDQTTKNISDLTFCLKADFFRDLYSSLIEFQESNTEFSIVLFLQQEGRFLRSYISQ